MLAFLYNNFAFSAFLENWLIIAGRGTRDQELQSKEDRRH
jgi:hypothetical protein